MIALNIKSDLNASFLRNEKGLLGLLGNTIFIE